MGHPAAGVGEGDVVAGTLERQCLQEDMGSKNLNLASDVAFSEKR